jgi:hypothetical protein
MKSFVICTVQKYCLASQIKEYEMGRACRSHFRYDKLIQNCSRKPEEKDDLESRRVDGRIILKRILKLEFGLDSSGLERVLWPALVNTVKSG